MRLSHCMMLSPNSLIPMLCSTKQEEWEAQLDSIRQDLQRDVVELSRRRREAAGRMSSGVDSCLKELSMSRSHFDVGITWQEAKEVWEHSIP